MDDIEAIKQLKARYFRTLDTKDWDGMRRVFTDEATVDTSGSGGPVITGADEFIAFVRETLGDRSTVHIGHMPEIELTSESTATGIWSMQDLVQWPDGRDLRGYGHYHETYEKTDGVWRIASSRLTRLRMDIRPADAAGAS
ncbi:MAG TPA: nuclear transport factor 2 family protein [Yinghuangia sp.]|uniref:nuclear transport factor 2 family protein n=1 Tax=Yinghuangia sp. YIM S10712 TaxID=3436930 RepID=UPI002C1B627F|nr:nuclear transport factor 2 family protein [Yinghuangia sp.]